jgi:hypothetical protein
VQQAGDGQGHEGGGFEFLGDLTALTHLDIAVPYTRGFASISSCTALQMLQLRLVLNAYIDGCLGDEEWEAVGSGVTQSCTSAPNTNPAYRPGSSHTSTRWGS